MHARERDFRGSMMSASVKSRLHRNDRFLADLVENSAVVAAALAAGRFPSRGNQQRRSPVGFESINRATQDSPKGQPGRSPPIDSIRFARDIVSAPGRCSKCADARRWNADTAVNETGGGGGARIGVLREVPRGYMARASHGGSCEHACSDQCSRQKFKLSHSNSPLDMKSQYYLAP